MKKILVALLFLFFTKDSYSQFICNEPANTQWRLNRKTISNNFVNGVSPRSATCSKVVRINFHFMLKSNGTGNFTETGDNLGNTLTGYQFAKDIVAQMNWNLSYNIQMNIEPNNTTPVNAKNYSFVIDAVYFHRDDSNFSYPSGFSSYTTYGADKSNVLNIFLTDNQNANGEAGYANDISQDATASKFTENYNFYKGYVNYRNNTPVGNQYAWVLDGSNKQLLHECGHLLSLSHTVLYPNGDPCPTVKSIKYPGTVDSDCDDGCLDTPTAWRIVDELNSGQHPGDRNLCNWQQGQVMWCSNNMMDYSGSQSLTPCQLNLIHTGLEGGLKGYTACEGVKKDLTLCDIGFPKLSYFGKIVTIGCTNSPANLVNGEESTIFFSDNVILNNFEITGSVNFEVIKQSNCCATALP